MRLDAMRSFVRLVETGSYASAADALYMSPTTLHSHVKALEEELNTNLVSFEGRHMSLTRAGAQFLLFAENTLAEYDLLRQKLSGLPRPSQTTLRVVSLPAPSTHLLPPVVRSFQEVHPNVHVAVDARFTDEALAALVSRQADLAIVHAAHAEQVRGVFEMSRVFTDRLVAVIRRDLYAPPDIALMERYPLATQQASSLSRQVVERWARTEKVTIRPLYEHTSFDGILAYVLAGHCVGIVGGYAVAHEPMRDLVQVLDLPSFQRDRHIVALYSARAGRTVRQFVEYFRCFYEDGMAARERN